MSTQSETILQVEYGRREASLDGYRVRFSAHRCFAFDGSESDRVLLAALRQHLMGQPGLALYAGNLANYLIENEPALAGKLRCIIADEGVAASAPRGVPVVIPEQLPADVKTVFLAETLAVPRQMMHQRLPEHVRIIDVDVLPELALDKIPARAWIPDSAETIYPIELPEIRFQPDLDLLLIDVPARNLGMMPNGLGYVHNALKKTSVRYQTLDLDIIVYHRFHLHRLFDEGGTVCLSDGRPLPQDPWQAEHYDWWSDPALIDYFQDEIDRIVAAIVKAHPKILGISIQQCNELFAARVVQGVKKALPETVILVGGFSCYHASVGLRAFPEADYMCIGEADLTVGPLVERLADGERPKNVPGVLSRYDDADWQFIPGPMPHNLDRIEFPKYEWFDSLDIYRNYNGYQLTPVIASRGCRWARCTFCAERFYWRMRSAKDFVDELQWLVDQGCTLFMFNESDLNGMPEKVIEICDEIIRRGLKIKLTGQLRIHKLTDRDFFDKLKEAGFVALRFGVDAFSRNTLRLQKKGYTPETIYRCLKDCWEAGIYTEVNWVIGVPGETDEDIEEGIQLLVKCKPYIGRIANLNPLILVNGSVYWLAPEAHNIVLHEDKDELYERFPRAIPADLWHSTDPYIDADVRKARFQRIVLALHKHGFDVGPWASKIIDVVDKDEDASRSGGLGADTQPGDAAECEPKVKWAEGTAGGNIGAAQADQPATAGAEGATRESEEEGAAAGAGAMRAASTLGEKDLAQIPADACFVRSDDAFYAVRPEALRRALGSRIMHSGSELKRGRLVQQLRVLHAATKGATPELLRTIGSYNLVRFDGTVYAVPHSLGKIKWGKRRLDDPRIIAGKTVKEVARILENRLEQQRSQQHSGISAAAGPQLCGAVGSYNIVLFEGQCYAVPQQLGEVPWGRTDVARLPGVLVGRTRRHLERQLLDQLEVQGPQRLARRVAYWYCHISAAARRSVAAFRIAPRRRPVDLQVPRPVGTADARYYDSGQKQDSLSDAAVSRPESRSGDDGSQPVKVGELDGYNIYLYERWYYGVPQRYGEVDLREVDAIEMPGVIRDVSQQVVESEIRDLAASASK